MASGHNRGSFRGGAVSDAYGKKGFSQHPFSNIFYVTPGSIAVAAKNDHASREKMVYNNFFAKVSRRV
jgi:hypothetical protein